MLKGSGMISLRNYRKVRQRKQGQTVLAIEAQSPQLQQGQVYARLPHEEALLQKILEEVSPQSHGPLG